MGLRQAGPSRARPRRRLLRLLLLTSAKPGTGPSGVVRVAEGGGPGEGRFVPRSRSQNRVRLVPAVFAVRVRRWWGWLAQRSLGRRRRRRRRPERRRWVRAASGASPRPGTNPRGAAAVAAARRASGAAPGSAHVTGAGACGPRAAGVRARSGGPGEDAAWGAWGGGRRAGGVAGVSLSVQGVVGEGRTVVVGLPRLRRNPSPPGVGGRESASAPGPSCALLLGSYWGESVMADGGGQVSGPAPLRGQLWESQPSRDVSRPYLRIGARSDGGDAR